MIASVSTFSRSIGATRPLCTVKACIEGYFFFAAFSMLSPAFEMSLPMPAMVLQPASSASTAMQANSLLHVLTP